jgi:hypothetical protein
MAQIIRLKRSSSQGAEPSTSDLALGEVGINTYDGRMFIKKNDGSDAIVEVGTDVNRYTSKTVSTSITLDADTHYLVGKATTINNGIVLAIPVDSLLEIELYTAGKTL